MTDESNKIEQKKPENNGNSMFDQMVRKQVRRQQEKYPTYNPGEVRVYDPSQPFPFYPS